MIKLDTLLEPYRDSTDNIGVVTVIDDVQAKKLLAAWTRYNPSWTKPKGRRPADTTELWYWLWEGVDVDTHALAAMANVSPHVVGPKFEVLIHARLVLPDGTITTPAKALLNAFISENLPTPKKR